MTTRDELADWQHQDLIDHIIELEASMAKLRNYLTRNYDATRLDILDRLSAEISAMVWEDDGGAPLRGSESHSKANEL